MTRQTHKSIMVPVAAYPKFMKLLAKEEERTGFKLSKGALAVKLINDALASHNPIKGFLSSLSWPNNSRGVAYG